MLFFISCITLHVLISMRNSFFFKYLVQHATLCMISSFDVSAKQRKLQKNQTEDKAFTIHLINLYISFSVSNLILR